MVSLIMGCALVLTVPLILICGAIAPVAPPPIVMVSPPAIIEPAQRITTPGIIGEGDESMSYSDLRNTFRERIVKKSIEVMRRDGVSDEVIKKKMLESFSLDDETIDKLMERQEFTSE